MRKHTSSLEGFIPRQSGSKLGDFHSADKQQAAKKAPSRQIKTDGETVLSKIQLASPERDGLLAVMILMNRFARLMMHRFRRLKNLVKSVKKI